MFLIYQTLAMAASSIPRSSGLSQYALKPFADFLTWTTQWQTWDMFVTIPYDHRFIVRAYAIDDSGNKHEIGPILPGLKPFEETLRIQTFFYRIYPGSNASLKFWETYANRLCASAKAALTNLNIKQVSVDFVSDRTRTLTHIQRDGKLTKTITSPRGPHDCK
jgi:hypothetical protein